MSILKEIKAIRSGRNELRKFGIVFAVAGAVIGGWLLWKHRHAADYTRHYFFLGGGAVFLLLGLAVPAVLKPLQKVWMTLAVLMGWVMTRLILSLLYFIVFTGMRGLGAIFGQRFLELKSDPAATTYWIPRTQHPPRTVENYERQF